MRGPTEVPAELWETIARQVRERATCNDVAHDMLHVERVVGYAVVIARRERLAANDVANAALAALMHELFALPKNHPDRMTAGDTCARLAQDMLSAAGAGKLQAATICSAIAEHSFSKGAAPRTVVSQVLQDADRLDAIGAWGLARMWATCASLQRPFYDPADPLCEHRAADDSRWGLDHVFCKLLKIPERLHTNSAKALAADRIRYVRDHLEQMRRELADVRFDSSRPMIPE